MSRFNLFANKRARKWIMAACLVILLFSLLRLAGQKLNQPESLVLQKDAPVQQTYNPSAYAHASDSLRALYGKNKQLIQKYELQILLALAHYPELRHTSIRFYEDEALIPLASRPEPASMFRKKKHWQYNVIVSTQSMEWLEPILLKNLPFDAQVGIIGHELAHTSYYLDKNIWEMILIGLNYPFPGFRASFEKNTDRRAIAHGLGWQLLDFARFARKVMSYEETSFGSQYYLSPEEIEIQMQQTY